MCNNIWDYFISHPTRIFSFHSLPLVALMAIVLPSQTIVGFTRIAVNCKFHSWFRNLKLTSSYETTTKS